MGGCVTCHASWGQQRKQKSKDQQSASLPALPLPLPRQQGGTLEIREQQCCSVGLGQSWDLRDCPETNDTQWPQPGGVWEAPRLGDRSEARGWWE